MNAKNQMAAGLLALAFTLTGCEPPAATTPAAPTTPAPAQPAAEKPAETPAASEPAAGSNQKGAADVAPPAEAK